jgi:hypothetical protein
MKQVHESLHLWIILLHDAHAFEHAAIFPTFMTKVQQQTFFKRLVTVRSGQLDSFPFLRLTIRLFPHIKSRKKHVKVLPPGFSSVFAAEARHFLYFLSFPRILHVHHLTPDYATSHCFVFLGLEFWGWR